MNSKKLISVALTATTVLWALGVASLPLAQAQTTANLQAQIAALLAQIQQLQAQLGSTQGSGSAMTYSFTSDLTVGSRGADVNALQQLLINKGYLTAVSAPTGYFGSLTQAALGKFQAANGIHPAAGYFGPITRAFVNSMSVGTTTTTTTSYPAGCTSSSGYSPTTGQSCASGTTTTTTVTPPATGLAVSLAPSNPAAGSLISSDSAAAARVPVLAINLTAANSGAVTVTDIKVHKTGVLSDSSISGAYLVQNGQVLYQYTSLNQGVIDFSSLSLSVSAGQTQTLVVAIDPSTGLDAGNTVGFAMNAASDISAFDASNNAITPSGGFPLNGNIFTVTKVSNPSLATLEITTSSIATQVTAGTQNNIVGAWQFRGSNSLTWLKGIKFTVIGSANMADIRNVKLNVNGTQVGQTLATVGANGVAYFDLSSSPASLGTGANNIQVYADVMGSPSKNFQFEVLNSYDVYAVDSQYNVPISVTLTSGADAAVGIAQGTITVTQDSGTPTGNIAVGQSGVTLAKFDIYAAGEAVKVKFLGFEIGLTGVATTTHFATLSQFLKNISLVDDAGGQVGTTINTPPSSNSTSNACDAQTSADAAAGLSSGTITAGTVVYLDCFGSSASPINYIVPANTTRVLSLKADIQSLTSPATFATITAKLGGNSLNLQGLTSSQTNSSGAAGGSSLSLQSSLLTVAANSAYGNQVITPNTAAAHIGSYAFTASSASGIQINTLSIEAARANSGSSDLGNLKVMIGGTQFGTTQGVVADGSTYSFSGSPFTVPAGQTTYVDVYADILSNATTTNPATTLTGCSGTSVVSYSAVSCVGTKDGQTVTVATTGATISVALDSSAPVASYLVMGATGNTLAAYRIAEVTNVENVKITDLTVTQNTLATASAFQNLVLYTGSTAVGTSGTASSTTGGGFAYKFHFATPILVPQAGAITLTLKGDVPSYTSLANAGVDDTTSTFQIATSTVTALGASSNIASKVSGGATGAVMTVLRTVLTPTTAQIGASTGRSKLSADNLGTITLAANSQNAGVVKIIRVTFSGNAIATSTAASTSYNNGGGTGVGLASFITLLDSAQHDVVANDGASATSSCATQTTCWVQWTLAPAPTSTTATAAVISAGQSYTYTLQLNDISGLLAATGQNSVSLGATIQSSGDVQFWDSADSSGNLVSTMASTVVVPMNVMSATFASGS